MEHQSCTLLAEFIVTGKKQWEWITAHEMAHQWFGDLVTCREWKHIWLNEGFASFFEAVWQENFYGPQKFADRMANAEKVVADYEKTNPSHTVVDPPASSLFSSIVYYKGCFVLYMLRTLMGRERFDAAIREYLETYAFGNAETEDLRRIMEKHYGESLRWFFDQWLYYGTGSPVLRYLPKIRPAAGGGWEVDLLLLQVQAQYLFRLPVEIRVTTTAGTETRTIRLETARQDYVLAFDDQPLTVTVDPDNRILGRVEPPATAPSLFWARPEPPPIRVWPNPFTRELHLAGGESARTARVFDTRGRLVASVTVPPGGATWAPGGSRGEPLPPGVYYIRAEDQVSATRVVLLPR
jgi:aminopeptidase N